MYTTELPEFLMQHIIERIVDTSAPSRIILFGSRARGDARPDSDLDLLIILQTQFGPNRSRWDEVKKLRSALSGIHPTIDVVVFAEDELERFGRYSSHLVADAVREGTCVYTSAAVPLVRGAA